MKKMVAIVGRPNVGKSTLFNRLIRERRAIVADTPGVTRDVIYGEMELEDKDGIRSVTIVDTGGFETEGYLFQPFRENVVWQQTRAAIVDAGLVIFVVDGREGLHPYDSELARELKRLEKPTILAVNKIDAPEKESLAYEFHQLGYNEVLPISSAHGFGVPDLKLRLSELTSGWSSQVEDSRETRIAIIGRPNAGKSSILNRLVGSDRSLVSDLAGTTRDALDTRVNYHGESFVFIDTAGIRRRARINDRLESISVGRALTAIERAHIVLLVIDAEQGLTEQDARLAALANDRHRALMIVVNKWDLIPGKHSDSAHNYRAEIFRDLKSISYVPVQFISCLKNQRVHHLLGEVRRLKQSYSKRCETHLVNETMRQIVAGHNPALIHNHSKRIKFYYAAQVGNAPPTIVVFCNVADEIQTAYKRYMEHQFRKRLGFGDVPIKLIFRSKREQREREAAAEV